MFVGTDEEGDLGLGRLQPVLLQVSAGTVGDELRDLGVEELLQESGDLGGIGAGDRGLGQDECAFRIVDVEREAASGGADFEAVHLEAGAGQQANVAPVLKTARQTAGDLGGQDIDVRLVEHLHIDAVADGGLRAEHDLRSLATVLEGEGGLGNIKAELGDGSFGGVQLLFRNLDQRHGFLQGLDQPFHGGNFGGVGDGEGIVPHRSGARPFDPKHELVRDAQLNVCDLAGLEGKQAGRRRVGGRQPAFNEEDEREQAGGQPEQYPCAFPVHGCHLLNLEIPCLAGNRERL